MEAIQLYDKLETQLPAAIQMGEVFAKSGIFGTTKMEQGHFLAIECLATRTTPLQLVRTYHIIEGKLSKKALAIFAEFRGKGGKVKWLNTGKDGKTAAAEFTFEGQTLTESFTIEEAKAQGLVREKSNWIKTPANMLRARVLSNAIAMLCPEILAGVSGNPEDEGEPAEPKQVFADSKPKTDPNPITAPEPTTPPMKMGGAAVETAPAQSQPVEAEIIGEMVKRAEATESGKLTAATIYTLQQLIGEKNWAKALEWLKAKGKIKIDVNELSVAMAQSIIDRIDVFIATIGGVK